MPQPSAPPALTIVIYVAAFALVLFRMSRPQRISTARLWVAPSLLAFVGIWAIYAEQSLAPSPTWELVVAVLLGVALGVPLGFLRGAHTPVQATKDPGVMMLGSALVPALIYVTAFAARLILHLIFPLGSVIGAVVGDALLAFAVTFLAVSYFAIYRKFIALEK
ncbi:MAG: DUF1453 family protein [Candidatus Eremiobacteraeota bacterium]|uniref:DUF1453 domain-containing protein n=1 Tax=mine drainage metagenome TaxID=410659 RepID=E6PJ87_9ZZZZ|nr:DUF1453 family protein [Candidatus Eremiobacteraeota bacterium]